MALHTAQKMVKNILDSSADNHDVRTVTLLGSYIMAKGNCGCHGFFCEGVLGDGFMASGLTIQNTASADVHQAVAFKSDSDLSVIENYEFLGNQDTLRTGNLLFYKSCNIQGNVDFIL
ncbi:hypothetical protein L3X38_036683 [Prunus dulcis]|uniref:Pectinesterase catalytic domain-containing protein n=1 Tax=Prunus dulcis TaxID=3755 RepID=A0AAD4V388_PRUDU|nr:hypothetical protein L3X38_036683 [Prunus dulcis]